MEDCLKDYRSDFNFLLELKSYLKDLLGGDRSNLNVDHLKKGFYTKFADGRPIRITLPQGYEVEKDIFEDDNLYFVGFIGFRKPDQHISKTLQGKIWELDGQLIEELSNHCHILAYLSGERECGDWGNLVLLKSGEAIDSWNFCSIHQIAVREISSNYYSTVRLHRGKIDQGNFRPDRTLFLDYNSAPQCRTVKTWT